MLEKAFGKPELRIYINKNILSGLINLNPTRFRKYSAHSWEWVAATGQSDTKSLMIHYILDRPQ